MQDEIRLN